MPIAPPPGWNFPRIVAHRGGGRLAPENTLAAIRLAAARGFAAVEFDVMLSSDGMPVLIHDETLLRTTGAMGAVAETPFAELLALDAGAWLGEEWRGERLPSFEDAARLCLDLGLRANIEIKPAAGHERATGEVVARAAAGLWRGAKQWPLLSSFSATALRAAAEAAPELPRGCLFDAVPADWAATLARHGACALHCNARSLDESLCTAVSGAGYAILAWTVNAPDDARRLFGWGVDAVFTDALDAIGPDFAAGIA